MFVSEGRGGAINYAMGNRRRGMRVVVVIICRKMRFEGFYSSSAILLALLCLTFPLPPAAAAGARQLPYIHTAVQSYPYCCCLCWCCCCPDHLHLAWLIDRHYILTGALASFIHHHCWPVHFLASVSHLFYRCHTTFASRQRLLQGSPTTMSSPSLQLVLPTTSRLPG